MQPKFCKQCGNPLIAGDKFCRKCGAPIAVIDAAPAGQWQNHSPAEQMRDMHSIPQRSTERENIEGTVALVDMLPQQKGQNKIVSADLRLPLGDVLRGCTKVLDFGTGRKFEVTIPAGLSPGDVVVVKDTGLTDPASGEPCDFELRIVMD